MTAMPIQHAIWQVGEKPTPLQASQLAAEEQLREMIIQDPRILSNDWMIIGTRGAHLCQLPAVLAGSQIMFSRCNPPFTERQHDR